MPQDGYTAEKAQALTADEILGMTGQEVRKSLGPHAHLLDEGQIDAANERLVADQAGCIFSMGIGVIGI
ncbi:hypothetical protein KSX_60380 [Ktedonospora formicarum]|uniref:Uncharacterized protein n=2 Tax=Ktedonospora formicarum TaxID=2778364 RepID=A0A8J3MU61_9CHLR|nr:hypothetical protein KSX_60380 [Ktedonospora formicarum]